VQFEREPQFLEANIYRITQPFAVSFQLWFRDMRRGRLKVGSTRGAGEAGLPYR